MEPLSIQAANLAGTRPVLALGGDLSAVLKEGRVVAGQVLERLDGSTILIGLGRHRVPAESALELAPGQRFVARVEGAPSGLALRVLGSAGVAGEPALLAALRSTLGSERPIGELLSELSAHLRSAARAGGAAASDAARLAQRIEGHVARPGAGGAELRSLLARAGQGYEALLLAGLRGRDPRAAGDLADELAERVRRVLLEEEAAADEPAAIARVRRIGQDLGAALARALLLAHRTGPGAIELATTLDAALKEALSSLPLELRPRLGAAGARAASQLLARPAGEALLRRALGLAPADGLAQLGEELLERASSELARRRGEGEPPAFALVREARARGPALTRALESALRAPGPPALSPALPPAAGAAPIASPSELRGARLLALLEKILPAALGIATGAPGSPAADAGPALVRSLFEGPAGEALLARLAAAGAADEPFPQARGDLKSALLAGLLELPAGPAREALARALAGLESEQLLNLARREQGEGTHLVLPLAEGALWQTLHLHRHPRRRGGSSADGEPFERVDLALELSHLGPLRAELGWRAGELSVRISCANEAVAALLRAGAEELRSRLGADGARVGVHVVVAQEADLEPQRGALDVGYLREHTLLDLCG